MAHWLNGLLATTFVKSKNSIFTTQIALGTSEMLSPYLKEKAPQTAPLLQGSMTVSHWLLRAERFLPFGRQALRLQCHVKKQFSSGEWGLACRICPQKKKRQKVLSEVSQTHRDTHIGRRRASRNYTRPC